MREDLLALIEQLSIQEPKSLPLRLAKLMEESGELAKEILIASKASGSTHKSPGEDGVLGECADVLLVAFSIFFSQGGSPKELEKRLYEKAKKWEKYQSPLKEVKK